MARPFASVLIDTYNHERFIEQAIVSVLEQDFPPSEREIIVVDDGSSDRTVDVVSKFKPQVRLLQKTNGGQASAFNVGIPECKGPVVAFLDGDDWWASKKLERVVGQFEINSEVGTVGHGLFECSADGQPVRSLVARGTQHIDVKDQSGARLFTYLRWCLGTSRLTIRKSLLDRILPVPEILVIEADEWIFTLAAPMAPVVVLNEPLFHYRMHEGNLYQFLGHDESKLQRKRAVLDALYRYLPDRLRALPVYEDVVETLIEPLWIESERLRLWFDGGTPLQTFQVERVAYRHEHVGATGAYRGFNAMVLGLAMLLPPRKFYRLRKWYAARNLAHYRSLIGNPVFGAPVADVSVASETGRIPPC